jgi:GMP synthase (glutamine-hydrolysing)
VRNSNNSFYITHNKKSNIMIKEILAGELHPEQFIDEKVNEIKDIVGNGIAINALSGGVDSSAVTMIGHRALGDRLKTVFIDNDLMRQGEPEAVAGSFRKLGVKVEIINAKETFLAALKGITDPEEKREAITQTFYRKVFGQIVRESGIKRQHNVFEQLGIDTQEAFGYRIIEPLIQLRKDGVRIIGKALGLPEGSFDRIPFPGPALAARIIGEVTRERLETVRKATVIVEKLLSDTGAFQYMAILHHDRVTGMRDGKRDYGQQIEVRCWDSVDARVATPAKLPFEILEKLAGEIINQVPGIVSVTYNIAPKPPSTMEAV